MSNCPTNFESVPNRYFGAMGDGELTYHLSRDPEEYQTDTLNAIEARELAGWGVTSNPGESIRYVTTEYQAAVPSDRPLVWEFMDGSWAYDVERYTEQLIRAVDTVLAPFGINARMLRSWLVKELPVEHLRARLGAKQSRHYLGSLFELANAAFMAPLSTS